MRPGTLSWLAGTIGAVLAAAVPVGADLGYASNGEVGFFSTIRLESGYPQSDLPFNYAMSGLAISPSGELFGAMVPIQNSRPARLARLDPVNVLLEVRGVLDLAGVGVSADLGLAFDALGRLWLATREGRLYQVDPANGHATLHSELGIPVLGLAGCGTTLYALTHPAQSPTPIQVLRIDPDEGVTVSLGAGTSEVYADGGAGLDFTPDGRLLAVLRTVPQVQVLDNSFAEFDPVSGDLLGAVRTGGNRFNGFAIAPPPVSCPEPEGGVTEVPSLSRTGLATLIALITLAAGVLLRRSRP